MIDTQYIWCQTWGEDVAVGWSSQGSDPYQEPKEVLFRRRRNEGKGTLGFRSWTRDERFTLLQQGQHSQTWGDCSPLHLQISVLPPPVNSCQWWLLWGGREMPTGLKEWEVWPARYLRWWEDEARSPRAIIDRPVSGGLFHIICYHQAAEPAPQDSMGPKDCTRGQDHKSHGVRKYMERLSYGQLYWCWGSGHKTCPRWSHWSWGCFPSNPLLVLPWLCSVG